MTTRRGMVALCGSVLTAGCLSTVGDDGDRTTTGGATTRTTSSGALAFSSPAVEEGSPVPTRFTCDGAGTSPPFAVDRVPDDAAALAFVLDDPDAPDGTYTHWLVWNLPAETGSIPAGLPQQKTLPSLDARQGTNSDGTAGYTPPCPPTDDGPHTYRFTLVALDTALDLAAGAKRAAFDDAVGGATLVRTRATAAFGR